MEKQLHLVIQAFLIAAPGLRENCSNDLFSHGHYSRSKFINQYL